MKPEYHEKLATLRSRIRSVLAFQGMAYIACTILALVLLDMGLDRLLRLDTAQRVLVDLVALGIISYLAYRYLFSPLSAELSDENVAVLVEHRFPELGDRLISALQFSRMLSAGKPISPQLAERVMQQAAEQTATLPVTSLIDTRRLTSVAMLLGGFALLGGGAGLVIPPDAWKTWARRNLLFQSVEWPYDSKVKLPGFDENHEARVPSGDAFVLQIEALRERPDGTQYIIPETVEISFRFSKGDWQTVEPRGSDGVYRYPLGAVFRPVEIRVKAGDYASPLHRIAIARRPELTKSGITIGKPAYTRRKAAAATEQVLAAGSVPVPVGSRVVFQGSASKDLSEVRLVRNGKAVSGVKLTGSRTFEIPLEATDPLHHSGSCKIILRDSEGVTNHAAALFTMVIEPDRLPVIRARPVGIGDRITRVALVPFLIEIRDKYGIAEVGIRYELHRRARSDRQRHQPLHGYIRLKKLSAPGLKKLESARHHLDLEQELERKTQVDSVFQKARAGDRLRVWIEATDHGVGQRLHRFPEQGFHFTIVQPTVLHKHLLERQRRLRRQYSALVERQKGISWVLIRQRNMTEWKVTKDNATLLDRQGTEQRRILRASLRLSEQITQIREQMENNRLDRKGDLRKKLQRKVIGPMKALASSQMTPFAASLERMARKLGQQPVKELDDAIDEAGRILSIMQQILLSMERSEVFDEVVTRLRTIIRLQQELRRLTEEAHRKKVEGSLPDILGQPTQEDKDKKVDPKNRDTQKDKK